VTQLDRGATLQPDREDDPVRTSQAPAGPTQLALERARQEYAERRRRDRMFGRGRFGEPTWDLLLDLFVAAGERREVRISSACIAAAVPTSTALRHVGYLVSDGLVLRRRHPTDTRSSVVELSPPTVAALNRYFESSIPGRRDAPSSMNLCIRCRRSDRSREIDSSRDFMASAQALLCTD
jgi:DNA-binding MarR family transcriptional regulator